MSANVSHRMRFRSQPLLEVPGAYALRGGHKTFSSDIIFVTIILYGQTNTIACGPDTLMHYLTKQLFPLTQKLYGVIG